LKGKGKAYALASATIVNAIALGKGSAFGIDLKLHAEVEINDSGEIKGKAENAKCDTTLIEKCVEKVFNKFNLDFGAKVTTTSEIPMARGLSSSSAAANAVILATCSAIGKKLRNLEAINLGVEGAIESRVTITGAFDDASASYFGGVVVTDNIKRKILLKEKMQELSVLIFSPREASFTSKANVKRAKLFKDFVAIAFEKALKKDFFNALTLNGLIYCSSLGFSPEPALLALENGALASGLTGTGSAFVALAKEEAIDKIKEAWQSLEGEIIITKTNNEGAKIVK